MTQFLLGRALYTAFAGSVSAEDAADLALGARAALQRAVALRPSFAEAWAMLGTTYTWDDHPDESGIDALERAFRLLPDRGDIGYNLVLLHVRRNQRDDAVAVIDRMQTAGVDEQFVVAAEELTLDFEMRRADRLSGEGRVDEATAVLNGVKDTTTDPRRRQQAEDEIRRLRDAAVTGAFNETYNRAVQLINAGEIADGVGLLERLVDDAPSADQAATARTLLDRTRAYAEARAAADEALALANSGDIDAAIAILEPLVDRAPGSAETAEIGRFLDKLHAYSSFQERYNEAVDLVNGGEFDAAIAVLAPLVGAAPTPQLSSMAELLLNELEGMR
jgi:soluble cytochrome b562